MCGFFLFLGYLHALHNLQIKPLWLLPPGGDFLLTGCRSEAGGWGFCQMTILGLYDFSDVIKFQEERKLSETAYLEHFYVFILPGSKTGNLA